MTSPTTQGFRLSPQQRRIWSLQQDSSAYQAQCAVLLEGNLSAAVLEEALQLTANRHEILRTTFHCLPGMDLPLQVVGDAGLLFWSELDFSDLDPARQESILEDLFEEERRYRFDFKRGPLFRASLLRLSESRHVLFTSVPLLCGDARSLRRMVQEISQSYDACLKGFDLCGEPLQYVDFSEWQNGLLETKDEYAEQGRQFWVKQGVGSLDTLELPAEKTRSEKRQFEPHHISLSLNLEGETIAAIASKHSTSDESVFLLGCWATLLWRLTGLQEIAVGYISDGRSSEDMRNALGLFAKCLPVRCRFTRDLQLREILRQVSQSINNGREWEEYASWERIVESNGNGSGPSHLPFLFEYEEEPARYVAGEVSFTTLKQYACIDRFKVKLSCHRSGDDLTAEFHYDSTLYDPADISRLAEQYQTILRSAAQEPGRSISRLEILSPQQREMILNEFNQTRRDYDRTRCVHEVIEEQAEKRAEAVAVVCDGQEVSYRELNARSNQLANYLRSRGVCREQVVGVMVSRGIEMAVGLLGVMKAGAAYLPLDGDYPKQRLAYMVEDAGVKVVITQQALADRLQEFGGEVILLDSGWEEISKSSERRVEVEVWPENLAYVIYTSGSTGKPKGVMIQHGSLLNYCLSVSDRLALEPTDTMLQFASISFDVIIEELFPTWMSGARLALRADSLMNSYQELMAAISAQGVTIFELPTAYWQGWVEELASSGLSIPPSLRMVIVGGERMSPEKVAEWASHSVSLMHVYGVTEATVTSSLQLVECGPEATGAEVSIGKPIGNTQMYVLDAEMRPVGIAVIGELYIGGEGVGRGYLNRAELTGERFIPNPHGKGVGERMYRTGDMARYRPGGELEFIGRKDEQVKVRGYRIELGEIEGALKRVEGVSEAVVIVREEEGGEKRVEGYVVLKEGREESGERVRERVREELPEYMVPSRVVVKEKVPLTWNGKVDKRALMEGGGEEQGRAGERELARDEVEEEIARIWEKVLKVDEIGVEDNFFELGGHSLLATQVVSRMVKRYEVGIPLRLIFERPTVRGIGEWVKKAMVEEEGGEKRAKGEEKIERVRRGERHPLSFAQQRLWFLDQLDPGSIAFNISLAVRITGLLNLSWLEQTMTGVVSRHGSLRTSFPSVQGLPTQVIGPPQPVELPLIDLSELREEYQELETKRLVEEESRQPFDLSTGPMLRVRVVRRSAQHHVVMFTMHHIVSDGWSMGVFIREVAALYEGYATGKQAELAELEIQYADYAAWQRKWMSGEVLKAQLNYWRNQLGGELPVLELPIDKQVSEASTHHASGQFLKLPASLCDGLRALSNREGATLFMTMLAAFEAVLYKYSGQRDILIGTNVANRNRVETEGLIGLFINQLVLRTDLSGNPTFRQLLARVRDVVLGAQAHQDLPFEKLVHDLRPERHSSVHPLFQVKVVFEKISPPDIQLTGLTITQLEGATEVAKCDLTLIIGDLGQEVILSFNYRTGLFDSSIIARMLELLKVTLDSLVNNPDARLEELEEILVKAEKRLQAKEQKELEKASLSKLAGIKLRKRPLNNN